MPGSKVHVLGSEDESRCGGARRIVTLDGGGTRWQGRGRDVFVMGAWEDGASRRCKTGIDVTALNVDFWQGARGDWPAVGVNINT